MYTFCVKMSVYFQIMNWLLEKLTYFGLEVSIVYVILSLYVINCFKYFLVYILEQNAWNKSNKKNCELHQNFMCWIVLNIWEKVSEKNQTRKIFELYQFFMCQIVLNISWYMFEDKMPRKIIQEKLYQAFMYNVLRQND